jgi:hypothetical protein
MNVVYPMANDDLLQQFKELLAENNKQLEQNLRQDFQKRLDAQDQNFQKRLEENNKQLQQEIREDNKADIKAEVDPLHERMDTQYKNLTGQINAVKAEITHDVANLVGDTLIPLFDEHEAKIAELQKAVGLRPKH